MIKPISGFNGYLISDEGFIISGKTGRRMKCHKNNKGYYIANLFKDGKYHRFLLHRLVAIEFVPNPNNKPEVNHINGDKECCAAWNLEWCTRQENNLHAAKTGLAPQLMRNNWRSKKVAQYSLDGDLIKVWPSLREVERDTGFDHGCVGACCNGKVKKSYGYIWKYLEGVETNCTQSIGTAVETGRATISS